ncbi:hypothetical protein ABIE88_003406 [Bradyrhizobium diazoefficiens]|uniref:hypothetical protein n=1 Tax=Bradyrhizobium diazoefficiens TaxID=1355477 RepID=UPI003516F5BE
MCAWPWAWGEATKEKLAAVDAMVREQAETPISQPLVVPNEDASHPVLPNEHYVSVWLRSMRITHTRFGTDKYYGCVHSFISLLDMRQGTAEFHVISTPEKLRNVDAQSTDGVVTQDIPLLKSVPYRGDLRVQLGLFSIKAGDLTAPYLNMLDDLSGAAGVGFVRQALQFVNPIKNGINLLLGGGKDVKLDVGVNKGFPKPETGTFIVMRAPSDKIDVDKLTLNKNLEVVDDAGKLVKEYPYLIFSVATSDKRDNWFEIPEIKKAHEDLMAALDRPTVVEKEAYPAFRYACFRSPDLIDKDAEALAKQQGERLAKILPAQRTGGGKKQGWELKDLNLYGA